MELVSCAVPDAKVAISDGINAVQEAERYEASKYARYHAKAELMLNAIRFVMDMVTMRSLKNGRKRCSLVKPSRKLKAERTRKTRKP